MNEMEKSKGKVNCAFLKFVPDGLDFLNKKKVVENFD